MRLLPFQPVLLPWISAGKKYIPKLKLAHPVAKNHTTMMRCIANFAEKNFSSSNASMFN
jgi:hypothetical protein